MNLKDTESESVIHSVMSNFLWPHERRLPGSSVHGILQSRILQWVSIPFYRALNSGLLNCRQFLYHLSHQGSPKDIIARQISQSQKDKFCTIPLTWDSILSRYTIKFPGSSEVSTQSLIAKGPGSIPGQGTKFSQAVWHGKKINFQENTLLNIYIRFETHRNKEQNGGYQGQRVVGKWNFLLKFGYVMCKI